MLPSMGEGKLPMKEHPLRSARWGGQAGRSALGYPASWDFSACSGEREK